MVSHVLTASGLVLEVVCACNALGQSRAIEGAYRNPALGYSITIPRGLKGVAGDEDGPERGIQISLPSGGKIVVFGEPNSLEYKSPEDGVRAETKLPDCSSSQGKVAPALVGRLKGAKGSLTCGERVLELLLVFRTHGGPIYWLRLETVRAQESEDKAILETIAASFRLIRWE